ncbi:hypothetical protein [Salinarimonas soli]|uniref:Uncharacterized protein n=1 Tax=Salinarimonas soli TaxID=1638099 RepID=A0A5B2VSR3_9HYPH|nr:hypothetical protein [Salinarimonas soli]KAA2241139.1 hypothetical protein F0L46_04900 [Salinarimonas soli]
MFLLYEHLSAQADDLLAARGRLDEMSRAVERAAEVSEDMRLGLQASGATPLLRSPAEAAFTTLRQDYARLHQWLDAAAVELAEAMRCIVITQADETGRSLPPMTPSTRD